MPDPTAEKVLDRMKQFGGLTVGGRSEHATTRI